MSEREAEDLIRKFIEHKMMWHSSDNFADGYIINQAINILGQKKVDEITQEIRKIWNDG